MEFNKCSRCGCFFSHAGNVCPNCVSKDSIEIQKLENYLEDYTAPNTIEQLSYNTGITHLSNAIPSLSLIKLLF